MRPQSKKGKGWDEVNEKGEKRHVRIKVVIVWSSIHAKRAKKCTLGLCKNVHGKEK